MSSDPFDDKAATWDTDPSHVERAKVVAQAIRREVPLSRSMRTLEYGAGTGLVSEELQNDVGPLTLADTSAGMREVIASKVTQGRLPEVKVADFDLGAAELPDGRFELIVTVLTLHHMPDLKRALQGLHSLLEPGGQLCVVDLDKEDGSFHGDGFGGHHGFDRGELSGQLRSAGFDDVRMIDCHYIERDDGRFPMFLAVATLS
ncbi:MAG: class I SAM-dependent methyltransferase [Microthrixaceae bacterium]|nr:class I SAM-dependent methyltransferase [Microthrixaceae bacterium]